MKNGGRGASGRRGDRPRYRTVLGTSWERVRYASAPGCPGGWRASCALTDLHTHSRQRRSAGTLKCTLLYTYDALPPRVAGDLRGIHNRTRLRRRIDAGGPLAGPPSRPGAQTVPPCCSAVLCRGLLFVFLLFEIDFDEFKKVTQSSVPSSSSPPRLCL